MKSMVFTVFRPNSCSFMILSSWAPLPVNTAPAAMPSKRFLNSLAAATWPPVKVLRTVGSSCGKSTRK